MPWLRAGDTSAMFPKLLSIVVDTRFDDRLINEAMGFLFRCATQAASYITDYVVDPGTAYAVAGSRAGELADVCVHAGLMEVVDLDGVRGWKIIDDPEFLHMKTAEEIAWEKQRKADNGNPALIIPVRIRDGDACRYCGKVVNWNARRGKLAATYDHRKPGQAATVDTLVVCCSECNARRGNDPDADTRVKLMPPPKPVYYHKTTIEWINNSSWRADNGLKKLPPKRDKFVPCGSVPPGHESHVPVPEKLLIESPVEPAPDSQSAGDGTGVDSQTPPPLPACLGDAVPSTPAPDAQSGSDGIEGDSADETTPTESTTDTAVPGLAPASATPAPDVQSGSDGIADGGRASSDRAATCGDTRQRNSERPAKKADLPKKSGPAGRQCAGAGIAGSGRDGTERVGNGKGRDGDGSADGETRSPGSSRGSGRKRRRRRKKGR